MNESGDRIKEQVKGQNESEMRLKLCQLKV